MTWNLGHPEIKNMPAKEAHGAVEKSGAPQYIRDYAAAGINGLVMIHGKDVKVNVTGHGHLCEGVGSFEVTDATVRVSKGDAS